MKRTESLREPWLSLLNVFREADQLSEDHLTHKIETLSLEKKLQECLIQAVRGDNRPLNQWLFSKAFERDELLAWIAPVIIEGGKRHAWMIGKQSELMPEVERRFIVARKKAATDSLLLQRDIPPPLLFIRPLAVSKFDGRTSSTTNEFAIFQTGYRKAPVEIDDFHQRMVMNCDYLTAYRQKTLERARQVIRNHEVVHRTEALLPLFSLIHSEGHNQGHFLGPWPYHEGKECVLGEALEEYRACLAAIRLAKHLGLSEEHLNDFAVSVFIVRFLGYGFDAFCLQQQKKETAREISVGLMFFETLVAHNAVHVSRGKITIPSAGYLHDCLVDTLKEIHDAERTARKGGIESLRALATHWYTVAFPDRNYSTAALEVYRTMVDQR